MRLSGAVLGVILVGAALLPAQQQITWQEDLPPLKMSFKDLEKIARRVVDTVGEKGRHSLEIRSGQKTLSFAGRGVLDLTAAELPESAENADYQYFAGNDSDPVTLVSIHFSDNSRGLRVQGNSPSETEKLFRVILSDVDRLTTVGGFEGVITVWFVFALMAAAFVFYTRHHVGSQAAEALLSPLMLSGMVFIMSAVWWQPRLLPGFGVFSGEVAWYRRYGLELGLALTVLGILPAVGRWFARLKGKQQEPQEPGAHNEKPDAS